MRRRTALVALALSGVGALLPAAPAHAAGGDDYPYRTDTSRGSDPWGFTKRQCTSFAAWRLQQAHHAIRNSGNAWGNASHWDEQARALHMTVSARPKVGAVAQWNSGEHSAYYANGSSTANGTMTAGSAGHVAYVAQVYGDGSVKVEQYNTSGARSYSVSRVKAPRYLYVT